MTRLRIDKEALLNALKKFKGIVDKKPFMPVLGNVMLQVDGKTVSLIASDNDITLITSIELEEEAQPITFLLPYHYLLQTVELTQAESILFEIKKNSATISAGMEMTDISKMDKVEDFPKLPEFNDEKSITVDADFIKTLNQAVKTTSQKAASHFSNYVCVDIMPEVICIVSTNISCLYTKTFDIKSEQKNELLLQTKVIAAVKSFDLTNIGWTNNHVSFECGNTKIIAKRPETKFVAYKDFVTSSEPNLKVSRIDLLNAMKQAMVIAPSAGTLFQLSSKSGVMELDVRNPATVISKRLSVKAEYTGECESIKLVPEQLENLLEQVECETILLSINSAETGVLITSSSDENYKSLIMPIK